MQIKKSTKLLEKGFKNFSGISQEFDLIFHFKDQITFSFNSIGWWECTQIGERLIRIAIESCKGRVNFGGYILTNVDEVNI